VSIGLAGFAGVTVILGRGPGRWQPADEARIRTLLYAAFGALFASLTPIALVLGGISEAASIRYGAVTLLLIIVALIGGLGRSLGRLDERSRAVFRPRIAVVILAIAAMATIAQIATALGLAGSAGAGLFFFGLSALLGYSAFSFIRLMFIRPPDGDD
jgi:hypothetical protein